MLDAPAALQSTVSVRDPISEPHTMWTDGTDGGLSTLSTAAVSSPAQNETAVLALLMTRTEQP
jgi:hypothetical protein